MYPELLLPVGGLALIGLMVAGGCALRGTVERRLAIRNALRRRSETVLVVAGSLLGTAIIVGALIVGDTLNYSIRQTAFQNLGPTDEIVLSPSLATGDRVRDILARLSDPSVDTVLSLRRALVAVSSGSGDQARADPSAQAFEMDFAAARSFGGDGGVSGPTPLPGEVVIDDTLAGHLRARAGDTVTLHLFGAARNARVARVIPLRGVGGLADLSRKRGLFVAPGTLVEAGQAAGLEPDSLTLVSNQGGVLQGAARSAQVSELLRRQLGGIDGYQIATVKADVLQTANEVGNSLGSLFLFIGTFSIIAGVLLLVTIFTLLADERKPELGMMRAVGMRRAQLVRSYLIEGAGYSLAASLLGIPAGLAVGRGVEVVASRIFSANRGSGRGLSLGFHVTGTSVANGATLGFLIAFLTVAVTSIAISRINIVAAIRDLPAEGFRRSHPVRTAVGVVLGLACAAPFASGVSQKQAIPVLLFPALAALLISPLARRALGKRPGYSLLAGAVVAWCLLAGVAVPDLYSRGGTSPYTVLGFLLTAAATVLLTQNQELIAWALHRLTDRPTQGALSVRLAVAYPVAKRNRTGLILLMYSVVVFTLVLLSILSGLIGGASPARVAAVSAGYDLEGDFNALPPGTDPVAVVRSSAPGADLSEIKPTVVGSAMETPVTGKGEQVSEPVMGVDSALVAQGLFHLRRRDPRFASDAAAWQGLLSDPSGVIVNSFFGRRGGGGPPMEIVKVGDRVRIAPVGGVPVDKTVIGITADDSFQFGTVVVFLSRPYFDTAFTGLPVRHRLFMRVKPGVDPAALASRLEGALLDRGLGVNVAREVVQADSQTTQQFFSLIRGFLGLGLLVGIAGLGVVMLRAVRERRREIGILRALGFETSTIRRAFLSESAFVALEGILIGTVLAVINTYLVYTNQFAPDNPGVPFRVPVLTLAVLLASAAVVSLAATAWPARQASRVPPAVALRAAD